jgi:hypothetical protein
MGTSNIKSKYYVELVNTETGEITYRDRKIVEHPEQYVTFHRNQLDYLSKLSENSSNQFTFALQDNVGNLLETEKIGLTTLGAILVLLPYLDNDGYLKKMSGVKDKPYLTRVEMIKILKVSEENFKKIISNLKESGLISVEGTRVKPIYRINQNYHIRGSLPNGVNKVVRIQNNGINSAFKESNMKLDQLGFLYLLIPHLSYDNCRLVKDVNGTDTIENALSLAELSEKLGLSENTVQKYLKMKMFYKFREGTYQVPVTISVCAFGDEKQKSTLVNPLIYRRNMMVTGEIRFKDLDINFRNASKKIK